jgi:ubiquinone/menaquinone biosynthesis C-methylase UbiE
MSLFFLKANMLPRVLEPEVMDSAEEARDYDSMDHSHVNRVFVTDFLSVWDRQSPVLDVGTGTAQIPIELCRQAPKAQVVAIDLAEQMLEVGRENVRKAGFADRIRLERQDAKQMPYASQFFAAVISNSIVHHIPDPGKVLAEIVRVTRAGGLLFVRDLLRPPNDAVVGNLVFTYAGDANAHQQKMFAESLRAALSLEEIRALVSDLKFDPATVEQTTDRHWTWRATYV